MIRPLGTRVVIEPKEAETKHGTGYDGKIYDPEGLKDVICSAGAGLKIAMNQNFIVSVELAKCLYNPLDAGLWIGIGINYQF